MKYRFIILINIILMILSLFELIRCDDNPIQNKNPLPTISCDCPPLQNIAELNDIVGKTYRVIFTNIQSDSPPLTISIIYVFGQSPFIIQIDSYDQQQVEYHYKFSTGNVAVENGLTYVDYALGVSCIKDRIADFNNPYVVFFTLGI